MEELIEKRNKEIAYKQSKKLNNASAYDYFRREGTITRGYAELSCVVDAMDDMGFSYLLEDRMFTDEEINNRVRDIADQMIDDIPLDY